MMGDSRCVSSGRRRQRCCWTHLARLPPSSVMLRKPPPWTSVVEARAVVVEMVPYRTVFLENALEKIIPVCDLYIQGRIVKIYSGYMGFRFAA